MVSVVYSIHALNICLNLFCWVFFTVGWLAHYPLAPGLEFVCNYLPESAGSLGNELLTRGLRQAAIGSASTYRGQKAAPYLPPSDVTLGKKDASDLSRQRYGLKGLKGNENKPPPMTLVLGLTLLCGFILGQKGGFALN